MSTLTRAETPTQSPCRRVVLGSGSWPASTASTGASRPLLLQVLERRRVLGVEDVGHRMRLLGDDLVGEGVLVVVADVDLDPGLLLERGDERLGRLLVLAAVERDGLAGGARRRGGGGQQTGDTAGGCRRGQPQPHARPAPSRFGPPGRRRHRRRDHGGRGPRHGAAVGQMALTRASAVFIAALALWDPLPALNAA